ncbi:hypothetical protein OOK33_44175, partial [Streptomyces sp. NBC_00051]|nr:hypothetical protein [Streptomyces sp. NBC_00051]
EKIMKAFHDKCENDYFPFLKRRTKNAKAFHDKCENDYFRLCEKVKHLPTQLNEAQAKTRRAAATRRKTTTHSVRCSRTSSGVAGPLRGPGSQLR